MSATRRGFSLMELLAVVAVVATLVSLLLPGLAGARESARSAACASGARQLYLGATMYADDHRDLLPPGASDMLSNLTRWHGSREAASAPFRAEGGPMDAYLTDRADPRAAPSASVRACPSFAGTLRALADSGAGFERSAGGYGYNNAYAGVHMRPSPAGAADGGAWAIVDDRRGAARAMFANPARSALFADAALAAGGWGSAATPLVEYSFIEPRFRTDSPASRLDPSIHFRHGGANVAHLDGHVAREHRSHTWSSGVYPHDPGALDIGWFGPMDDNSEFDYR